MFYMLYHPFVLIIDNGCDKIAALEELLKYFLVLTLFYSQTNNWSYLCVLFSFKLTFNRKHKHLKSTQFLLSVKIISSSSASDTWEAGSSVAPEIALWPGSEHDDDWKAPMTNPSLALPSPCLQWRGGAGSGPGRGSWWSVCSPG